MSEGGLKGGLKEARLLLHQRSEAHVSGPAGSCVLRSRSQRTGTDDVRSIALLVQGLPVRLPWRLKLTLHRAAHRSTIGSCNQAAGRQPVLLARPARLLQKQHSRHSH